jgi:phosphoglucomutase
VIQPHPLAGRPAPASLLVDLPKLVTAYYTLRPDPANPSQRVSFGTSGHRGSSLASAFNEPHILAMAQAVCAYRATHGIDGPLFLGWDTHALSEPARATTLEVMAANGVEVLVDSRGAPTPTPVVSRAILAYNRGRTSRLADGLVMTPSHNPPEFGGYKYDPPSGGPAESAVTSEIEAASNALLQNDLRDVKRMPYERAVRAPTVRLFDYREAYIESLASVIDVASLRGSKISIGVDPLGGSSAEYWDPIAARYGLRLEIVNREIDATFRFMTVDWDGAIRMDPSSSYAMARLIDLRGKYDVAFANDPDADRHGIVCPSAGLMNPNHYLAAAADYLFRHRPRWPAKTAIGKTVVTSSMIDRVAAKLGRTVVEVPVGFKYFVHGLLDGTFGFAGEESAGASLLSLDGSTWTTDKDGLVMGLLAVEMCERLGRDPGEHYALLARELGDPAYERIDAEATSEQKRALSRLSVGDVQLTSLAGDPVKSVLSTAPGNGLPIGGIKVASDFGWFAARPSGTEAVYKLYAESFKGSDHLARVQSDAKEFLQRVLPPASS